MNKKLKQKKKKVKRLANSDSCFVKWAKLWDRREKEDMRDIDFSRPQEQNLSGVKLAQEKEKCFIFFLVLRISQSLSFYYLLPFMLKMIYADFCLQSWNSYFSLHPENQVSGSTCYMWSDSFGDAPIVYVQGFCFSDGRFQLRKQVLIFS